jgi:hypothetical protein
MPQKNSTEFCERWFSNSGRQSVAKGVPFRILDAKLTDFASEIKARNYDLPLMHRSDARPT